jgi:two-component system, cell cycle sensor histidine kinase and response regulator CckA
MGTMPRSRSMKTRESEVKTRARREPKAPARVGPIAGLERKKTRGALRGSEDKFRDLAEKSLAGIYLIQDGVFKYGNPRFAEIFGYTVEELLGRMGPRDVVLPSDWPIVRDNIEKRVSGIISSIHYEFRGKTKSGEIIHIECYGTRTTYKGRPAVIGTLLDVTERERAQELLRQAEEKYRSIFENAVEGIFQITPQGQFIVVNPALVRLFGYGSWDELRSDRTYVRHQLYVEQKRRLEFMRILEEKGLVLGFECELYRKDRTKIWVSMNAHAVRDPGGATLYYEGPSQDITEQKKAEDTLRRLNTFNEAIIDNAPIAIFTLDRNGVFSSVNPALAVLSGLGKEAEQKLMGFNWLKNPYTIKSGLARYIRRGLRGEAFQLWDFPYMTYSGRRNLFMDFKGVPLKGKRGAIEGLLCIIEETTDRVKTRAKLMQEARMSTIGRLAAGIAHELNNPLAILVAHSELAGNCLKTFGSSETKTTKLKELKAYLKIIENQVFRCKNVTADILSLPWKEGLEITDVDVNLLLNNMLEFGEPKKLNGSLKRNFARSLPLVRGDTSALRQVFMNLVSNAVDAIEGRMDAAITIKTRLNHGRVQVTVEDNGIGIPDTIIEKIFEPFFTTKESKKGIGLGLSLCHEFLKQMGGSIRVESKPGLGTTFLVGLPASQQKKGSDKLR